MPLYIANEFFIKKSYNRVFSQIDRIALMPILASEALPREENPMIKLDICLQDSDFRFLI